MSKDNVTSIGTKVTGERTTIKLKDIECLALLTCQDEQFVIDDLESITRVIAFMQQNGIKWRKELYTGG